MNLDDLLRDTLTDDRWALPVPADTLPAVRRKRTHRQRRSAALALTSAGGAVGAIMLVASALGGGATATLPCRSHSLRTEVRHASFSDPFMSIAQEPQIADRQE